MWSIFIFFVSLNFKQPLFANPYPDANKVFRDRANQYRVQQSHDFPLLNGALLRDQAIEVLRIQVDWDSATDSFHLAKIVREKSGTPALVARSQQITEFGSYQGILKNADSTQFLAFDSIGTGQEYRKLVRSLTFRFPMPNQDFRFEFYAENPQSGVREKILDLPIAFQALPNFIEPASAPEIRLLKAATKTPKLQINIYAEGYWESRRANYWQEAPKVVQALQAENFPLYENMEIRGVFVASNQALGTAQDLGLPVMARDSYLGLYYPYWDNFGRWYHIVYPTDENKLRTAINEVPYDYPIAIVDSDGYWGIGNYNAFTAIPARNGSFTYLVLHEFGHFFGLNEEYDSGGATELAFAPGIDEPWSQNITFLRSPLYQDLKWKDYVGANIPLPTPSSFWSNSNSYGAYVGGYAETTPLHKSHKPGKNCMMDRYPHFCPICLGAIRKKIEHDLGQN